MLTGRSDGSVGVIIPTYERVEPTLQAVRSALDQTRPPAAIVVVDDGSGPGVVDRLTQGLSALPVTFIKAARTSHPGRVRNHGLATLDTEWVAFLDSDDTWLSSKLEVQMELATRRGSSAVYTGAHRVVSGEVAGLVSAGLPSGLRFQDLVRSNLILNSSVLVRRAVLDRVSGVAESYVVRGCEDYATWLRIASFTNWVGTPEPLVRYNDEVLEGIRGTEQQTHHPAREAAWLDYIAWRQRSGQETRLSGRVLRRVLPLALTLDARRWRGRSGAA